eukprot:1219561-Prorocentrum_lima.AAC.1
MSRTGQPASSGAPHGAGGGGGGGGRGASSGPAFRASKGWPCPRPACQGFMNFVSRKTCHQCGCDKQ